PVRQDLGTLLSCDHRYEALHAEHADSRATRWRQPDVVSEGDPAAQSRLRLGLYHLLRSHPNDSPLAIDPKAYAGAADRGLVCCGRIPTIRGWQSTRRRMPGMPIAGCSSGIPRFICCRSFSTPSRNERAACSTFASTRSMARGPTPRVMAMRGRAIPGKATLTAWISAPTGSTAITRFMSRRTLSTRWRTMPALPGIWLT